MPRVISICDEEAEAAAEAARAEEAARRFALHPPPHRPMTIKLSPALEARFSGQSPEQIIALLEDATERACQPPTPPALAAPGAGAVAPEDFAALAARVAEIETKLAALPAEFQNIARAELNRLLRG